MLTDKQIERVKKKVSKIDNKILELSQLHDICADPTRMRLMYLFSANSQLCPTDISNVLDLSMSAVSHQVRVLEEAGMLDKVKMGKMICYSMTSAGKKFFKNWIKL
jgi:DNA-binding transcriptional ArsR family regulator